MTAEMLEEDDEAEAVRTVNRQVDGMFEAIEALRESKREPLYALIRAWADTIEQGATINE